VDKPFVLKLLLSFSVGGLWVVSATVLAEKLGPKVGGPLWGGVFSMFPAMFLSTMLVTYAAQGALFSAGVMKSAMLGGASVAVYAVVVRIVYMPLGIWLGALVALAVSFGSGWPVYKSVVVKLR
jgi:hypothetical protein